MFVLFFEAEAKRQKIDTENRKSVNSNRNHSAAHLDSNVPMSTWFQAAIINAQHRLKFYPKTLNQAHRTVL